MTQEISAYIDGLPLAGVGGGTYNAFVSQDGVAKRALVSAPGRVTAVPKTTGLDIVYPTDFGPVLVSTIPTITTWKLQTFYLMGFTRVPGTTQEIACMFERRGLGTLDIIRAQYRGEVASQAAMVALAGPLPALGDWCQRRDLSPAGTRGGQIAMFTGTDPTNSTHWTLIPFNTANRPNIAWGTVADDSGMSALANALVGDFCINTAQSGNTYQLAALPASTVGNWKVNTTANKPVDPGITFSLNGATPASLLQDQTGLIRTGGMGNDYWIA